MRGVGPKAGGTQFLPGSHGETVSGLRRGGPEAGGTSLGWVISRNSIFYLVPMGRWGGSILRGGSPEPSDPPSLGWAISWNSIFLPGSHGETGRIRIEGSWARSRWLLPRVSHVEELNFYLVPMGRRGGSGLRGGRPEVDGASLRWGILRNLFFFLVPMGRQGGSGLSGGGPEADGSSLG